MTKYTDRYDDQVLAYQYEYTKGGKSNNGDIEYYCTKICKINKSVLEIGCGTGRITIPLKRNGMNITGVDIAKEMVALARVKSLAMGLDIPYYVANGATYVSQKTYDIVFVPFNSLCFIDNDELNIFILNLAKFLKPNGRLLFDFTRPSSGKYKAFPLQESKWSESVFIKELDKSIKWKMGVNAPTGQDFVEYVYLWEITSGDKVSEVMSTMQFSSYSLAKYIETLEQKGFGVVEVLEKPYMRDGESEIHYFCELKVSDLRTPSYN